MTNATFVYGTLKSDGPPSARALLRPAKLVGRASVRGTLYHLGPYPGLVREGPDDERVFGELYELPAESADDVHLLRRSLPRTARKIHSGRFSWRRGAA